MNHLNGRGKSIKKSINYRALLKNVKPHILEKILNIFYLDFVLFGYDIKYFEELLREKQNMTSTVVNKTLKN